MVKWIAAMALGVALMFTGFASAKDKGAKGGVSGKVTAVAPDTADKDVTDITILAGKKKDNPGTEKVIKATKDTKVMKGDASATLADVVVGANIKVEETDGKATTITIVEHKKKT